MLGWSVFSEGPTNGRHNLRLRMATSSWAGLECVGGSTWEAEAAYTSLSSRTARATT